MLNNKKEYKVLVGNNYESMLLSDEEIKIIDDYGKCESDKYIMLTCNNGQKIPSYQIDDYKEVDKRKTVLLRECSDYDIIYGVVVLKDGVGVEEFQNQINNIKNIFMEHNIDDWTIKDVLELLRKKYDFEYKPLEDEYSLEI